MIKPRFLLLPAFALALASCKSGQSSSTDASSENSSGSGAAVTAAEPSAHFATVMSQIDVGGHTLHYQDHEGRREMWTEIAEFALNAAEDSGEIDLPATFDVEEFIRELGILDAVASGRSISSEGDHWLLKQYTHYGKKPKGVVELMGKAQAFTLGDRLSESTDIALEMRLDGAMLPEIMTRFAEMVGESREVESGLSEELPFGMTVAKMLGLSQAHLLLGMELAETGEPGMPVIPGNWVLELTVHKALMASLSPMMKDMLGEPKDIGGHSGWSLAGMVPPAPGVGEPILVIEGEERLRLVSSAAYLAELDGDGAKLAANKIYQSATDHFPATGNLQLYLSPQVPSGISKWMDLVAGQDEDALVVAHLVRKITPEKPWSMCVSIGDEGIHTTAEMPFALDANNTTVLMALGGTSTLFVGARAWKRGSDRSVVILNIRNCQQAMRGHANLEQLNPGDPFTREDLEEYMMFPQDIKVDGGYIRFEAGDKVTKPGELWLKVTGPGMDGAVGEYGFMDESEYADW